MAEISGVVNEVPVANDEPPVESAYQFTVPALAVAAKLTVPESQSEAGVVLIIEGVVLTVAVTAVIPEGHTSIALT